MARPEPKGNCGSGLFPRELQGIYKGFAGVIAMFALRFAKMFRQLWLIAPVRAYVSRAPDAAQRAALRGVMRC
jgi:hypothetical protein